MVLIGTFSNRTLQNQGEIPETPVIALIDTMILQGDNHRFPALCFEAEPWPLLQLCHARIENDVIVQNILWPHPKCNYALFLG